MLTHDNTWPVALKFMSIGATSIADPSQLVFAMDHDVQNKTEKNLKKYSQIEEFAKTHGIYWSPPGRGIGHQIMVEEGHAWPGTLSVASDSHSPHYGGIGCLGTAVVRTDGASIWATGKTWWQVPPIAKVTRTATHVNPEIAQFQKLTAGSQGRDAPGSHRQGRDHGPERPLQQGRGAQPRHRVHRLRGDPAQHLRR